MSDTPWPRVCIVGLGRHARTKLIPAVRANGQDLIGVVTRNTASLGVDAPAFATIGAALQALPSDTVFVLASPPTVHFDQAMAVLEAGRDLVVEKPAFVTAEEARTAAGAALRAGALLVEGFMNRHTAMHRAFLEEWSADVIAVDCIFTIPEAPRDTFRSDPAIGASNLYDIGSYFLAALLDAGLAVDELSLDRVDAAGVPDRERLHLSGSPAGVQVRAVVGIDDVYANRLRLTHRSGAAVEYSPFFYGRPGPRKIVHFRGGARQETTLEDVDAFQAMLAVPRSEWAGNQSERLSRMIRLTEQLERLGRALSDIRSAAA